jgi:hypothetical protein
MNHVSIRNYGETLAIIKELKNLAVPSPHAWLMKMGL